MNDELTSLRNTVDHARNDIRSRWNRDLPVQELVDDRWERARRLGFGQGSSIYADSYVYGDVSVGENTWIGPHTLLDGTGGLSIGRRCDISAGVQVYTHDTVNRVLSDGREGVDLASVEIGDNCHIGAQSVIAKGVRIGDHVVIGACSFVNRDIPSFTVAVGVPCRPIGRVIVRDNGGVELVYERHRPNG